MKTKLKPFLILLPTGAPALLDALQRLRDQAIPARMAYELSQLYRQASDRCQDGAEARNNLIRQLGRNTPAGPVIEPNTPEMHAFIEELTKLGQTETEVQLSQKIRLPASLVMKASDWDVLEDFVELDAS